MVVRGVRISCETARRRLARIRSFSLSALIASWYLTLVVNAPVSNAIVTMTKAEIRLTGMVKLNAKYGNVKA